MTAMTPGLEAMLSRCDAEGGTRIAICPDDETIAWCTLPTEGRFAMHVYHFSRSGPHAFHLRRARTECERLGGTFQASGD